MQVGVTIVLGLLTSLAAVPAPWPPINLTCDPIIFMIGSALLYASCKPPHMIVSVPSLAFCGPPDMGASRKSTPRAWQAFAHLQDDGANATFAQVFAFGSTGEVSTETEMLRRERLPGTYGRLMYQGYSVQNRSLSG